LTTAIVVFDEDTRVLYMNSAAELLCGLSARQAAGQRLEALLPSADELATLLDRSIAQGQTFSQNLSLQLPHLDRQPSVLACRVTPVPVEARDEFILEMLDETQSRHLDREKVLLSQHGASRRIIRQLAHEIRNPLGGLRGAAQLLERELTDPRLREYTQVIIGEADRLVALTGSLLGPTRQPELAPVNIHEILERVMLLAQGLAPKGVRFYRDYDPSLPPVTGDRDQLIQALLNIARNSIEAVGEAGEIVFRTRALTGYVISEQRHRLVLSVEIQDDGPGVPDDIRDSIFYPLVTGRQEGTGLGLPLAQDLVSRHGGLIEFESQPGKTIFMIRLPQGD
jgi:two-component system nitrogen regulation sensor histidine kinase GlnL